MKKDAVNVGLISETDDEERQHVQKVFDLALSESRGLKSKGMEKAEGDIIKLRARRQAVHDDLYNKIKKDLKDHSAAAEVEFDDTMEPRLLTPEELTQIENVNLLIFEAKKRLRAEQKIFYSAVVTENEKKMPDIGKKIAAAQAALFKIQDEAHKLKNISKEFQSRIKGIENSDFGYVPKIQHLHENGPKQTLALLMDY